MSTEFDDYMKSQFGCVPFIPCNMASKIWDEAMNRGAAHARAANNYGAQPAHPPTTQGSKVCPHYFEATDGVHVVIVSQCNCKGKPSPVA